MLLLCHCQRSARYFQNRSLNKIDSSVSQILLILLVIFTDFIQQSFRKITSHYGNNTTLTIIQNLIICIVLNVFIKYTVNISGKRQARCDLGESKVFTYLTRGHGVTQVKPWQRFGHALVISPKYLIFVSYDRLIKYKSKFHFHFKDPFKLFSVNILI